MNTKTYIFEDNIEKNAYLLSVDDLELLKSIGIIEKGYAIRCKYCKSLCTIISENDLKKYKRFWELVELENQKKITNKQLDEIEQLYKDDFYGIFINCIECDYDNEIMNEEELSDYMENIEKFYRVIKKPDLTYEKL